MFSPCNGTCWPWHFLDLRDWTQSGPISHRCISCQLQPLCRNPTTGPNNRLLRPTPDVQLVITGWSIGWSMVGTLAMTLMTRHTARRRPGSAQQSDSWPRAKAAKRRSGHAIPCQNHHNDHRHDHRHDRRKANFSELVKFPTITQHSPDDWRLSFRNGQFHRIPIKDAPSGKLT